MTKESAEINKAVFLDRDGTINEDRHYLYRIEDFVFLPGIVEALRLLQEVGFLLIVVTNQSGIGRGYYTEADFQKLNAWMLEELKRQGVTLTATYYCPHLPDAKISRYRKDCDCRKPRTGLFMQAVQELRIDLARSYAIGDKLRDCAICWDTDCRGFLIERNESQDVLKNVKAGRIPHVRYAENLLEATKIIVGGESV